MRQVYAIEYDPVNEVIHAATGINYGIKSIGLTFSANAGSFGKLLQKWDASVVSFLKKNLSYLINLKLSMLI